MSHAITPSGRAVNPWWIALTLTIATFMELLDTSIANVSLPHIAGGLGTSLDEATWVLTSYLVANAVVLPLSAWLSRVFGHGLRGPVHAQLVLVRGGSAPWALNLFSGAAGSGWGRLSSFGTGDAGGHLSPSQARSRLWTLQHGYCVSAGTRTDPGRVDNLEP